MMILVHVSLWEYAPLQTYSLQPSIEWNFLPTAMHILQYRLLQFFMHLRMGYKDQSFLMIIACYIRNNELLKMDVHVNLKLNIEADICLCYCSVGKNPTTYPMGITPRASCKVYLYKMREPTPC